MLNESLTLAIALEESLGACVSRGGVAQQCHGLGKRASSGGANGGVLVLDQLLRLRRPRHQLAVQHDPISGQSVPRGRAIERTAQDGEQLALDARIVEEAAARARVHYSRALADDAEAPARDIVVTADHRDGARAHM